MGVDAGAWMASWDADFIPHVVEGSEQVVWPHEWFIKLILTSGWRAAGGGPVHLGGCFSGPVGT